MKIKIWKKTGMIFIFGILILSLFVFPARGVERNFCCEKTKDGAWCMDVGYEEECDENYRVTPTSCEATSYCKLGCCYDSNEGLCMENSPQTACNRQGGFWQEGADCDISQCQLGCCVLGNQAAYVSLTRCKKLSGFYGLLTDYRPNIGSEIECIALTALQDEGACVYEVDYTKECKFTTRSQCNKEVIGGGGNASIRGITSEIKFYKDYLCSAEELGTRCGPTTKTTCVEGKDEVYFVDSCGNPANIYDASKIKDKAYWTKIVKKEDSCGAGSDNAGSKTCGNCDYFMGSICKRASVGERASYGDYVCKDLDCKNKRHGESWCSTDKYEDSVGSRYFRHLCINGEEIIEPCADFRQEICIEDDIGGFSQAACRVNRWQDCYAQTEKIDCENKDKRDCKWIYDKDEVETSEGGGNSSGGVPVELACVPEHPPGLKFWESGESQGICAVANSQCEVKFVERGYFFSSKDCEDNCECLEDSWINKQLEKCEAVGDCGAKVNFVGAAGNREGYKVKKKKIENE